MALGNGSSPVTRALKSWTDIAPTYSGSATYTRNVTLTQEQLDSADWKLDLGLVANIAELTVNGTKIGDRIWPPYTISLGDALKVGTNTIKVRVTNTLANAKGSAASSGLLGPVSLTPSLSSEVTLHPTSITASEATATMNESGSATVDLTLDNAGSTPVTGKVTVTGPTGWTSKSSAQITVPAGGSATGQAHVFQGGFRPDDEVGLTASFVVDGTVVADHDAKLDTSFETPPAAFTDYVDLGDSTSETAHNLHASPTSGTNTEAGLTRRYGGYRIPDAWYEFDLAVTAGKSFAIQARETYWDAPQDKSYKIFVNGNLVGTRLNSRPLQTAGTASYRYYVPAKYVTSDKVTVRFQSLSDPDFADPSVADVWALAGSDDAVPPTVTARVVSDKLGDNGWYRGPATVVVGAEDDRDESPVVETGTDDGWQPYLGPIPVDGEAKHSVYYRAKDSAGNSSGTKKQDVWIDATNPSTQLSATLKGGIENSDTVTLRFTAEDALSGITSTTYRIDGGEWKVLGDEAPVVSGFGDHAVQYFSTDVAGNDESVGTLTVSLADVDVISAMVPPQVVGTASYGSTLTATSGSWNTTGLDYAYQWLRDGKVVTGRTATTYKIGSTDIGHRLAVKVTASKLGKTPATSTSAQTAKVVRASSKVAVAYLDTSVRKDQSVRLSITVSPPTTPRGTVRIYENGQWVKSLTLSSTGKVSYSLKMPTDGLRSLMVTDAGSSTVSGSSSPTRNIQVR
jgi:hypothetical protein